MNIIFRSKEEKCLFIHFDGGGRTAKSGCEDESVINMRKAPNLSIIKPLRIVRLKLFPSSTPFISSSLFSSVCRCFFKKLLIYSSTSFTRSHLIISCTFIFNFKSIYQHNRLILISPLDELRLPDGNHFQDAKSKVDDDKA